MVKKSYIPDRGHIAWLNFTPQRGHEQSGKRPALILSPQEYNRRTNLAICCPVTRRIKGYPFETLLPATLKTEGAVLCDHVKNLDWKARRATFIEEAPKEITEEVLAKLECLLKG